MDTSTVTIIVVIIFALIAIFSFVVYQQRGEAEIKILGMSLKIKGSNEIPQPKPTISAKDIISREGGLLANDDTGQGIEVEKVDVKDDVLLSSSQSPRKKATQNSNIPYAHTLAAQGLTAGGNITIQQFTGGQLPIAEQLEFFFRNIGLDFSHANKFKNAQFETYSNVWKSLQSLRLAGDDLWKKADLDNLEKFRNELYQTTSVVKNGEIFFEDVDRENLLRVLNAFDDYFFGKMGLLDYSFNEELITKQVSKNKIYKVRYEELLENIRISFRKRLSSM